MDTTAESIAVIYYYLGKNPKKQEKIRNEINEYILDEKSINLEKLSLLNETGCFIKESMRLYFF